MREIPDHTEMTLVIVPEDDEMTLLTQSGRREGKTAGIGIARQAPRL